MENDLSANFHTKKQRAGYLEVPGTCPLLSSNLCADFRTVAEGEHHPAVRIDRCVIHKPVEQLLIEIHRVAFLQAGVAHIFLVRKDVLDCPVPPCLLPHGRGDAFIRQILCDGVGRLPLHEQPVDKAHRLRLARSPSARPPLPYV